HERSRKREPSERKREKVKGATRRTQRDGGGTEDRTKRMLPEKHGSKSVIASGLLMVRFVPFELRGPSVSPCPPCCAFVGFRLFALSIRSTTSGPGCPKSRSAPNRRGSGSIYAETSTTRVRRGSAPSLVLTPDRLPRFPYLVRL